MKRPRTARLAATTAIKRLPIITHPSSLRAVGFRLAGGPLLRFGAWSASPLVESRARSACLAVVGSQTAHPPRSDRA